MLTNYYKKIAMTQNSVSWLYQASHLPFACCSLIYITPTAPFAYENHEHTKESDHYRKRGEGPHTFC